MLRTTLALAICLSWSVAAHAQSGKPNPLNNVYFGEQHLHTVNSPDAFAMGTRNTPDDAYRFCKGEAIKKSTTGEMVQKGTPYDWCAVTDHAEYLGIMPMLLEKNNPLKDTEIGKDIATGDPKKGEAAFQLIISSAGSGKPISYMSVNLPGSLCLLATAELRLDQARGPLDLSGGPARRGA